MYEAVSMFLNMRASSPAVSFSMMSASVSSMRVRMKVRCRTGPLSDTLL